MSQPLIFVLHLAESFTRVALAPELRDDQSTLATLRWMMQKDTLGQDMFLIGAPGSYRRWIALRYAEMMEREIA